MTDRPLTVAPYAAADHPAIVDNGREVSYAELRGLVATVARRLGDSAGVVGVSATHSLETIVGLYGVWAAGGTYCPVDPAFPAARREAMLAGCQWWLTPDGLTPLGPGSALGDIAYILFTSGSTGDPKPVLTPRRAIGTTVASLCRLFELTPADRVLQFASLNWDTCFEEILPTLATGATLVLDRDAHSGSLRRFLRLVERERVSVLDLPTAFWHELVTHLHSDGVGLPGCVRLVVIGGEAANPARLRDWSALDTGHARLLNTYGCTETTLITHAIDLPCADGTVPLGFALPHVVERIGDDSELLIGGPSVAAGYREASIGSAEGDRRSDRFVELDGERFFRTGDRVRRRADGALLPAGRVDAEVKIRGIRVDPSEVEAYIGGHPGVRAVAVCGVRVADHTSLVAFVVARPPTVASGLPASVVDHLRRRVPGHLIPSRIAVVADLVYTASGKVDRRATADRYQPKETVT